MFPRAGEAVNLDDVLTAVRAADIRLRAAGDHLVVDAPVGRLTPELRDLLVHHKPAILKLLAPVTEFVTLPNGPTLPFGVYLLWSDFTARGFTMGLDADLQFTIEPPNGLTGTDRAGIARWRLHLGALVQWYAQQTAVQ